MISGLAISVSRTSRSPNSAGPARTSPAPVSAAPITPPAIAAIHGALLLSLTLLLALLQRSFRHHGDILRSKIVRGPLRQAGHGHARAGQRQLVIALQVAALGGGQGGARLVAFLVVDDPQ